MRLGCEREDDLDSRSLKSFEHLVRMHYWRTVIRAIKLDVSERRHTRAMRMP